jgi:hypothetical protein
MVTRRDKRFENGLYTLPSKQAMDGEHFPDNIFTPFRAGGGKIKILYNRNILYNYTNILLAAYRMITGYTE